MLPAEAVASAKALRQPVLGGGNLCGWSRVNEGRGVAAKAREAEGAHGGPEECGCVLDVGGAIEGWE